MNVVVCDYCREQRRELVEAVDVIPAFTLMRSREKVGELGVCESHKNQIVPSETVVSNGKRPKRYKPRQAQVQGATAMAQAQINRQKKARRLEEVTADGTVFLSARQIAEQIERPLKSMGYVLRETKPVGIDRSGKGSAFVYHRDDLMRKGILPSA